MSAYLPFTVGGLVPEPASQNIGGWVRDDPALRRLLMRKPGWKRAICTALPSNVRALPSTFLDIAIIFPTPGVAWTEKLALYTQLRKSRASSGVTFLEEE